MSFKRFLEQHGCTVDLLQEDDGNGRELVEVTVPDGRQYEVSIPGES